MKSPTATQDWPYLKKYQEENLVISQHPNTGNRIVFMGDSITEFWSREHPAFFSRKEYINRGISGQTTPQMLIRFRADVILLKPKTVVLLAGGNDIAGNTGESTLEMIMNNIISMVELAKMNMIKVVLCSLLPANYFYWNPKECPAHRIIALNQLLAAYAEANQLPFVDYYSAMVDDEQGLKKEYSEDGVHPNQAGYQIMTPILEKMLHNLV
ncbi:SGNH/GDSL hydrolase family protein [Flavobacterium sp. UMI-01]|uniref:SGNH/GDSL hydrolase family protein n=1 Tax=Flavobacterium sp. UMI-01 TaxID=1441053 RepID=UPI001C7D9328|nr:SGNH/GDSL hydrolase family protein [Flavobacterium sp. UMI-01]GIZ10549.1 acylneuraminate cytidylyltransferase [Flavobacterium sp. UMI-01]